jgi:leader peptidase (prepilin peptidase)/N-methyltransferase
MSTPLPAVGVSGLLGLAVGATLTLAIHGPQPLTANAAALAAAPGVRPRLPVVAVGTGVLFAAVTLRIGISPELPAYLYLFAIGVALALLDLNLGQLPDAVIMPSYIVSILLLMPAGAVHAGWWSAERAVAGMAALFALFFALALAYPNGLGMGDVKLAGLLGMYLGWLSWNALFLTAIGSLLIAAAVGSFAIVTKHANRNVAVPIGPCLVGAAVLALFVSTPISSWYSSLITA